MDKNKDLTDSKIWQLIELKKHQTTDSNLEKVIDAVQEIEIALRGTQFSSKDGLFYKVEANTNKLDTLKEDFNTSMGHYSKNIEEFKDELLDKLQTVKDELGKAIFELDERVLKPDPLKAYIRGLIQEQIKEMADAVMKKWSWILGTIATLIPIAEFLFLKHWN
jgi:hypothetical protein